MMQFGNSAQDRLNRGSRPRLTVNKQNQPAIPLDQSLRTKYRATIGRLESKLSQYEKDISENSSDLEISNSFLRNVNQLNQDIEKELQVADLKQRVYELTQANQQLTDKVLQLEKELQIQRKLKYFWVDKQTEPPGYSRY